MFVFIGTLAILLSFFHWFLAWPWMPVVLGVGMIVVAHFLIKLDRRRSRFTFSLAVAPPLPLGFFYPSHLSAWRRY